MDEGARSCSEHDGPFISIAANPRDELTRAFSDLECKCDDLDALLGRYEPATDASVEWNPELLGESLELRVNGGL